MGKPQSTGNLVNALAQDSSNNIGIGGAANASFKLQVTGATNLTGALTGTSGTFSAGVVSQGAYTGFQYNSAGAYPAYNTYFGAIGTNFSNSNSELDIWNTVGGGFVFRRQTGASAQTALLTIASSGAATFSSSVGVGGAPSGTYGTLSVFVGISTKDDNNGKLEIGRYSSGAPNSYIKIGTNSGSLRITNAADAIDLVSFFNSGFTFFGTIPSVTNYIKYNFNVGTDQNIGFRSSSSIARLEATNDAVNANVPMEFAASSFIFTGGNVGIGTSPSQLLHIQKDQNTATNLLIRNDSSGASAEAYMNVSNGTYLTAIGTRGTGTAAYNSLDTNSGMLNYNGNTSLTINATDASAVIKFTTNNFTERMRITSGGYVGIGVTPKTYFSTWKALQIANFSLMGPGDGNGIIGANAYYDGNWKYTTSSKATLIELNQGPGDIRIYTTGSGTADNIITWTNGPFVANGGNSWTNGSSDIRLKKNFESSQGLAELMQIEAIKYHFNWEDDNAIKRLGFKAQNLQTLIPEMVLETGDIAEDGSSYLTITPDYILPVLVKAIQEQQAQIEELKAIVATK